MIRLEDTSGSAIAAAIARERFRQGSPTTGMVLTLCILSEEATQADATSAAVIAAREHPMRVLTLVPRPGGAVSRLDAEIAVGGDDGPGEIAVLRLRGDLALHGNSVAIPLLLPDTPVVAWWPAACPEYPAHDLIGRHAQRRITDAAAAPDPIAALHQRNRSYEPGDTDLSWTRITSWRSAIASILDDPNALPQEMWVEVTADNPSGAMLMSWLRLKLKVPVHRVDTAEQGIVRVGLETGLGPIVLRRLDHATVRLERAGVPPSALAMARREPADLMSEELRRLGSDEMYAEVLRNLENG